MKQTWFTCPRCGLQFKAGVGHNHHCPRCNRYPVLVGKVKPQQAPRPTVPLPPPTPSGSFPQYSGPMPPYAQPTQPGQFTQAGWPPCPPPPIPRPPASQRARANFSRLSKRSKILVGCGGLFALVLVCACLGIIGASGGNGTTGTATPGTAAQASHATVPAGTYVSPTPKPSSAPKPTATAIPKPTNTPVPPTNTPAPSCPYLAVNNNPWCYTFTNTGKVITSPDSGFCGVFPCITTFWNGSGYVVECGDGDYSLSGGHTGVCSQHGGYQRTLYMP